jgi:hypothetical protein
LIPAKKIKHPQYYGGFEPSKKQPQSYGGISQQGTLMAELLWNFVG